MMKFAKIIEVREHQVLITKELDSESDELKLNVRTDFEDYSQTISLRFNTLERRDKAFEEYDISSAEKHINVSKSLGITVNNETE